MSHIDAQAPSSPEAAPRLSWQLADPAATAGLGAALADLLPVGATLLLRGDLGAGKTCLVQGLAAGWSGAGPALFMSTPDGVWVAGLQFAMGGAQVRVLGPSSGPQQALTGSLWWAGPQLLASEGGAVGQASAIVRV